MSETSRSEQLPAFESTQKHICTCTYDYCRPAYLHIILLQTSPLTEAHDELFLCPVAGGDQKAAAGPKRAPHVAHVGAHRMRVGHTEQCLLPSGVREGQRARLSRTGCRGGGGGGGRGGHGGGVTDETHHVEDAIVERTVERLAHNFEDESALTIKKSVF